MRRRTVLTGLVVWTVVVAAVSAITWAVIDATGQDLLAGGSPVTDAAPVLASSATPAESRSRRPRTHPTKESTPATPPATPPTPARTAPSPSTVPTVPTGRARTWSGPAGVLSVRCDGATISLLSASPSNGYRIEVDRGSEQIEVHFRSSAREYQVKALCSAGTPRFQVESGGDEGGDD